MPAAESFGRQTRRALEMAAVFMIDDGVLGLVQGETSHRAMAIKCVGARLARPFEGRPGRRRAYGTVQMLAGVMLA